MYKRHSRDHGRVPESVCALSDNHREGVGLRDASYVISDEKGPEIASLQAVVGSSVVVKKER